MIEDAEYEIKIKDPKLGTADHVPHVFEKGVRRKLTTSEQNTYDAARSGIPDLNFLTSFQRMTRLIFTIDNSDYTFAPMPIVVNPGTKGGGREIGSRINSKRAEVCIPEFGRIEPLQQQKYSLLYFDKDGNLYVHDPVVLNGSTEPAP